jgi:hypothetical protein
MTAPQWALEPPAGFGGSSGCDRPQRDATGAKLISL